MSEQKENAQGYTCTSCGKSLSLEGSPAAEYCDSCKKIGTLSLNVPLTSIEIELAKLDKHKYH